MAKALLHNRRSRERVAGNQVPVKQAATDQTGNRVPHLHQRVYMFAGKLMDVAVKMLGAELVKGANQKFLEIADDHKHQWQSLDGLAQVASSSAYAENAQTRRMAQQASVFAS